MNYFISLACRFQPLSLSLSVYGYGARRNPLLISTVIPTGFSLAYHGPPRKLSSLSVIIKGKNPRHIWGALFNP